MKIKKIEIDTTSNSITLQNAGNKVILPIIDISFEGLFGLIKNKKKGYPTSFGPTFGSDYVHYFYYVDESGIQYDDEYCKQINNFLHVEQLKGNLV